MLGDEKGKQAMSDAAALIELYHWPTPVGCAIAVMLEECGLDYRIIPVDISKGDQFSSPFASLSPNGKLPLIVDPLGPGLKPVTVFESGAILLYLARKAGMFLHNDPAEQTVIEQWLFWGISGLGPMLGQNHHFRHYAPERIDYALTRYDGETQRHYAVLDKRLKRGPWLAGAYSVADIAILGWVRLYDRHGVDLANYPSVQRWLDAMLARPAVQRGIEVGGAAVERRFTPS